MTISDPSRRSRSSTGWQNVPTPGPYSTNTSQRCQSTGASILLIVKREDGIIEPTIRGSSTNPRKNTPHCPKSREARLRKLGRAMAPAP